MGLLSLSDLSGLENRCPTLSAWAAALASRDPSRVTALYAKDALLFSTLDAAPKAGQQAILGYFKSLIGGKSGLTCSFKRVFRVSPGVMAGLYVFRWSSGELPARFTFVLSNGKILHHHSSAMPKG